MLSSHLSLEAVRMGDKKRNMGEIMKQSQKTHEEWEDRLNIIDDTIDGPTIDVLIETLKELSKEVREKVLDEVLFTGVGEDALITSFSIKKLFKMDDNNKQNFINDSYEKPLIILNCCSINNLPEEYKKDPIRHEIAHFILGHYPSNRSDNLRMEDEMAVVDLVREWGFNLVYRSNL